MTESVEELTEYEKMIMKKGRSLAHIPRAPAKTYFQRLSLELNAGEVIVACWGKFPKCGEICEKTANNPMVEIHWVIASSNEVADVCIT